MRVWIWGMIQWAGEGLADFACNQIIKLLKAKTRKNPPAIDHCGAHSEFQDWCKLCQAVRDGLLENDNPAHQETPQ